MMRRIGGFTLIELMAVAAISAILAAVAYPAFELHVIRTRRTEAQSVLQELMQQQERYFSQHNRYIAFSADATDPEARLFRWFSGRSAATSAYEIAGRPCPEGDLAECIELVASPGTARVNTHFRDEECNQLTLRSTGAHLADGPVARCWR
jgi:type IV pilus assembly protein PilE